MPALFLWPPVVNSSSTALISNTYYAFYQRNVGIFGGQKWIARNYDNGTGYLTSVTDRFTSTTAYWNGTLRAPPSSSLGLSTGSSLNGSSGTYTTANGQVGQAGADDIYTMAFHKSVDFGGTVSSASLWYGAQVYQLLLAGSDFAGTRANPNVVHGTDVDGYNLIKVSATKYVVIYLVSELTGSVMGVDTFTKRFWYYTYDTGTATFSASAALLAAPEATSVGSRFEVFDAGEGYFYIVYQISGNLYIRGMDFTGASPVITGLLGGSGTASFSGAATATIDTVANQRGRYLTVGTDRVICLLDGTRFVRITFTSGTKATPTIATSTRTGASSAQIVMLEYDPTNPTEIYMVATRVVGGSPVYFQATYVPCISEIASAFPAEITIAALNPPALDDRGRYGGSSCNGENTSSALAYVGANGGVPYNVGVAYSCWHTPVNLSRSVNVSSAYSSVSLGREVAKGRAVDVTSAYSSVSSGIAIASAFAGTYQWNLSLSTTYTYGVNVTSTYSSVALSGTVFQILECHPLTQRWLNVGLTWMDDFMVYLNQDRAAVGVPPYKTWGADGQWLTRIDVANLHSSNMARLQTHLHDSPLFPQLQQTIAQRGDIVPSQGIAENIQFGVVTLIATNQLYGYTTAYDAWLGWHNSPPHYSNMIRDWGADADKVYSFMGINEGVGDPAYGAVYLDYVCNYLCNNFVVLELLMFEIDFTQYWNNDGALIAALDQQWSNSAWTSITQQYTAPYSVRVAASNYEAGWGCRVSAQHAAPITYSTAASMTAPYEMAYPVGAAQNEIKYTIKDTTTVREQLESEFALSVSAFVSTSYSLLLPVTKQVESGYAIKDTEPVVAQNDAGWSVRVSAVSEAVHTLLTPCRASNEVGYRIRDTQPVVAQVEAGWSTAVSAQTSTSYALLLPVRRSVESGYSIRDTQPATAQQEASWSSAVSAQATAGYALLTTLRTAHEAAYSIKDTQPVLASLESSYAMRVTAGSTAPYTYQVRASASRETGYAIKDTTRVQAQLDTRFAMAVTAQSSAPWLYNSRIQKSHTVGYGDVTSVRSQAQLDYALLSANPIKVSMAHYYAMQAYASQIAANTTVTVVLKDGTQMRVDDCVIDSAAGDVGYRFECAIADISTYAYLQEDDPLTVDFCGEIYYFFVESKSMSRNSASDVVLRVTATNEVARQGQPYIRATSYAQEDARTAYNLVDDLIEINFNYEIIDWMIPAGRLQVTGAAPLDAVRQIAEAVGAVVDGTPTGDMRLRYPYPVAMNALDSVTPDQTYSDDYDNLSVAISTIYRDGATKFRVREGDAAFSDSLEWVPDARQDNPLLETGIVKAYLSPYRATARISHLGNAAYVIPTGEGNETLVEVVEFNEGVGNTKRPIETLYSTEWITASMGTPSYAPFSTLLNANPSVNNGYGLAKVTYNARYLTANAGGTPATVDDNKIGPASSYAYFVLEESNG